MVSRYAADGSDPAFTSPEEFTRGIQGGCQRRAQPRGNPDPRNGAQAGGVVFLPQAVSRPTTLHTQGARSVTVGKAMGHVPRLLFSHCAGKPASMPRVVARTKPDTTVTMMAKRMAPKRMGQSGRGCAFQSLEQRSGRTAEQSGPACRPARWPYSRSNPSSFRFSRRFLRRGPPNFSAMGCVQAAAGPLRPRST